MRRYRVRFVLEGREAYRGSVEPRSAVASQYAQLEDALPKRQRSHLGCRECRQRKVKCDETFPVCRRCQKRGSLCQPSLHASQWQLEVPWLTKGWKSSSNIITLASKIEVKVDSRLMLYWLEATCRMLSVDSSNNPFSFPILRYVADSASLVHFLQSASAGQEEYFNESKMSICLEERGKALSSLRRELQTQSSSLSLCFFTLLMLGMSSSWIAPSPTEYGKEHLIAARTVADIVLKKSYSKAEELNHLALGIYVYWDMACSFCLDPADHPVDHDGPLEIYVNQARHKFHPVTTHSIDLYHILAQLGRYCRLIVDGGTRDLLSEIYFQKLLDEYESIESDSVAKSLTEAFRKHGLLLIYRFCGKPEVTEADTHILALRIMRLLLHIPSNSPSLNLQVIPILTAGAEMLSTDTLERDLIRQRLREIYSTNRLVPTLWVLELLEELWETHDRGITHLTWLELMLKKNWRLRVG